MEKICCTCLSRFQNDNAPVLTMSAYGNPKLLCPKCSDLIDTITLGKEYDLIAEAMQSISDTMSKANIDDKLVLETMTDILSSSAERAQKIKNGEYDFDLDEENDPSGEEVFDEIPEDLRETEEDKLLDEKEAEKMKKFDKVLNWVCLVAGSFALIMIIIKVVQSFL